MKYLIFDIETGPLPEEIISEMFSFDESKVAGFKLLSQEFDPASVKYGNLKDPEKIAAKFAGAEADFEAKKTAAKIAVEQARMDAYADFIGRPR